MLEKATCKASLAMAAAVAKQTAYIYTPMVFQLPYMEAAMDVCD